MNPYEILGVSPEATEKEMRQAWRQLAQEEHPDAGGSHDRMTRLNMALHMGLQNLAQARHLEEHRPNRRAQQTRRISQEMSSFTVSVLPVECWHALEIVAAHCGPLINGEPPYVLEFFLQDSDLENGLQSWCRCDLVPEAGSTTVHVTVGSAHPTHVADLEQVRDLLVRELNELDWPDH